MVNHPLAVLETVIEVADVAWNAMELRHHYNHHSEEDDAARSLKEEEEERELKALQSENRRLRAILEENLKLLQKLSESPSPSKDCPLDLHTRLVATVHSADFLHQLELLHQTSSDEPGNSFPFKEVPGPDLQSVETLVDVGINEPSWWVWVVDDKVPPGGEESSGIDNEGYVVIGEEQVVDGVANFVARCIISNPKAQKMTPVELQKTVAKALGGVSKFDKMTKIWHAGKIFYALSTWGLALAGLYRYRAVTRVAAKGIGKSGKLVMKAF